MLLQTFSAGHCKAVIEQNNRIGKEIAEKPFEQDKLTLTQQGDVLCMVH